MQRGFATIEIILATMIIALLMSVAIPNAARIIDKVALDYETKKFYSDLRFVQQMNRSATVDSKGLGRNLTSPDESFYMQFYLSARGYQILRGDIPIREIHYMRNIKKLDTNLNIASGGVTHSKITFDTTGKPINLLRNSLDGSVTLTSNFGEKNGIVFDSVGRFRGGLADE